MVINLRTSCDTADMDDDTVVVMLVAAAGELEARKLMGLNGVWKRFIAALSPDTLRALRDRVDVNPSATPPLDTPLNAPERALAEAGETVGACKMVRERLGCGLREAKDLIDAWGAHARARRAELVQAALSVRLPKASDAT